MLDTEGYKRALRICNIYCFSHGNNGYVKRYVACPLFNVVKFSVHYLQHISTQSAEERSRFGLPVSVS